MVLPVVVIGIVLSGTAGVIPMLYSGVSDSVRGIATGIMRIYSAFMPFISFCNCGYFVMRSGGKTGITFLFDTGCMWALCVPVAFMIARFTGMGILGLYACVQAVEVFKSAVAAVLLKKGVWIHNIVSNEKMRV